MERQHDGSYVRTHVYHTSKLWNENVKYKLNREWEWNPPYHTSHLGGCKTSLVHCLRGEQSEQTHPNGEQMQQQDQQEKQE